jgi:hypothetical protein
MGYKLGNLDAEAIRLQSIAHDAAERLAALERKFEQSRESGARGPLASDLDRARRSARAAQAAADAARRYARRHG